MKPKAKVVAAAGGPLLTNLVRTDLGLSEAAGLELQRDPKKAKLQQQNLVEKADFTKLPTKVEGVELSTGEGATGGPKDPRTEPEGTRLRDNESEIIFYMEHKNKNFRTQPGEKSSKSIKNATESNQLQD